MPKRTTSRRDHQPRKRRGQRWPILPRRTLITGAALLLGAAVLAAVMLPSALGRGDAVESSSAGGLSGGSVLDGQALFTTYCVACHGVSGVGERPDDIYAQDAYGFVAPPLDDTGHAWHHTDDQLIQTILEGSPRNSRMIAWEHLLTEQEVLGLVTYIKGLWSPYVQDNCQGPAHMNAGC